MMISVAGRDYEILFGSDIIRDGFYAEVSDVTGGDRTPVLEAFHSDQTGEITLSAFRESLPIKLVDELITVCKQRLPPSEAE
jgi:hypothetical protein